MRKLKSYLPVRPVEVAERSKKGKWRWNPSQLTFKNQKKQQDRFFSKDDKLYVWHVNEEYALALVDAGVKVAGSLYVLALSLTGGARGGLEFSNLYRLLKRRKFESYYSSRAAIYKMERYIKLHALACGVWDDGRVKWRPPVFGELEIKTLQDYYSKTPDEFIVVDDVVYYLRPYSRTLEVLFQKCVELAGSEYALALATGGGDRKKVERHLKAFSRMQFKHRGSHRYYAELFENFLSKNRQLFDEAVAI